MQVAVLLRRLQDHHRRLLTLACRAWDRAEGARQAIEALGLTYEDRYGQIKPNPALAVEATARNQFSKFLRELDLDATPPPASRGGPVLHKWRS